MKELDHEPAWLTAMVDQRLALLKDAVPATFVSDHDIVQTALTEPEAEGEREFWIWDNSCDNCGKFCPGSLICRTAVRKLGKTPVFIMAGGCAKCWNLE